MSDTNTVSPLLRQHMIEDMAAREGRQSLSALLRAFPELTIAHVTIGLAHAAGTCDRFSDGLASLGMRYS